MITIEKVDRRQKVIKNTLEINFSIFLIYSMVQAIFPNPAWVIALGVWAVLLVIKQNEKENFALILMLIPSLGELFIPGLPIPLANILIILSYLKIVGLEKKAVLKKEYWPIVIIVFYEALHIIYFDFNSIIALLGWIPIVLYSYRFCVKENKREDNYIYSKAVILGIMANILQAAIKSFIATGKIVVIGTTVNRFVGSAGDPNYFAMYALVAMFSIPFIINFRSKYMPMKDIEILGFVCVFFCISIFSFATLSRMMLIVLITSMTMLTIFSFIQEHNKKVYMFVVIVLAVLGIIMMLNPEIIKTNIESIIERLRYSDTKSLFNGRLEIGQAYINYITTDIWRLLFGVGMQRYGIRIGQGMWGYAHNMYIEILIGWGIIGYILVSICVINTSLVLRRYIKRIKLINCIPITILLICYISLNALDIETTYILLAYGIRLAKTI